MNLNKKLAVAVSGAVLLMAGQFALADSTTDIVDALVSKGVLTEEEGKLISKGAKSKSEADAKANKSRVKVSDVIDNAEFYGNMRARYEYRDGSGTGATSANNGAQEDIARNRARGKLEFGLKTNSGKWYSDLALSTGTNTTGISSARSDNFTFGGGDTNYNAKEGIYVKRAMLGWTPNDWLTLEAGRMNNPLYTTPMVWDGDYSVSGFQEKVKFTVGSTEIFGVAGQWANGKWDQITASGNGQTGGSSAASYLFAFQGGLKTPVTDASSAKIAVTQYVYGGSRGYTGAGVGFVPGIKGGPAAAATNANAVNDLSVTEVPAEFNYMTSSSIGFRLYGDYVINTSASGRADHAAANGFYKDYSGEDTAWLLGFRVASAKDLKTFEGNKAKAGDWSANLWYQEIGAFAIDPNLNDSDFFDSRLNMKGVVFKGQYNLEDNVMFNLAYGHGSRLNDALATPYTAGNDLTLNLDSMNLLQLDLTYKF